MSLVRSEFSKEKAKGAPIILVADVTGNSASLRNWEIELSTSAPNNPVFLLQGDSSNIAACAAAIANVMPKDAVCNIAGFSNGGKRCIDLALHLQSLGFKVNPIAVDTPSPKLFRAYIKDKPSEALRDIEKVISYSKQTSSNPQEFLSQLRTLSANMELLYRSEQEEKHPRKKLSSLHVITTTESQSKYFCEADGGWKKEAVAKAVSCDTIDGTHLDLVSREKTTELVSIFLDKFGIKASKKASIGGSTHAVVATLTDDRKPSPLPRQPSTKQRSKRSRSEEPPAADASDSPLLDMNSLSLGSPKISPASTPPSSPRPSSPLPEPREKRARTAHFGFSMDIHSSSSKTRRAEKEAQAHVYGQAQQMKGPQS